ncbi:S8 family peptidase [Azospirillum argentinense]|uniref:S8 family peptidase n=1 Tax=Azospirillum argentinense TaxID=2970906 RepID=A0ABW8V1T3_9PROT
MPEQRPLLVFPTQTAGNRDTRQPPPRPTLPTPARQGARLDLTFDKIEKFLERDWGAAPPLSDEIAPDRLLVFEVVQDIRNIEGQLRKLGFLWVGDLERTYSADDDFRPAKGNLLDGRILATVPTQQALETLLQAWREYKAGNLPPTGALATLFGSLKDLRRWGPKDRLSIEAEAYLAECLREAPDDPVTLELELWPGPNQRSRAAALDAVRQAVLEDEGEVISSADIPGAGYLAVLVRVRPAVAQALLNRQNVHIALVDTVQVIGPRAQAVIDPNADEEQSQDEGIADVIDMPEAPVSESIANSPDIALLDGLPLTQHHLLEPFLDIQPPDELSIVTALADAPAEARQHGTAMASLILYEDLTAPDTGYRRKLLVRPILKPSRSFNGGWLESIPDDMLFGDILHRAILDLKRGRGGMAPAAPNLKIISLSVGDFRRPFHGVMSGAAKILDWLSFEFNILFIVSAGNWGERIVLDASEADVRSGKADVAGALFRENGSLIISPAESINALTIGSIHSDKANSAPLHRWVLPIDDPNAPAPYTRKGPGFHGAVKPDLCTPGGRLPYEFDIKHTGPGTSIKPAQPPARTLQKIGQQVAAPGRTPGELNGRAWNAGTSNSTAIAAGAAGRITEVIRGLSKEYVGDDGRSLLGEDYWPVLTKALLVHGARWENEEFYLNHFGLAGVLDRTAKTRARESVRRHIGHGVPDFGRVMECTRHRATLLGVGALGPDDASIFTLPLPADCWDIRCIRRIITTVAWISPVAPMRAGYRVAQLSVAWDDDAPGFNGVSATGGDARHANGKGTIWHEVKETAPKVYRKAPVNSVRLRVQCRDTLGLLSSGVKFGLAVSFEIAQGQADVSVDHLDVYADIAEKVHPKVSTPA